MKAFFLQYQSRLKGRADSEHEQAFIRLAMLGVVLVYLLYQSYRYPMSASGEVLPLVAIGFVVGAFIVGWLLRSPELSHSRRTLGMLADYGLMTTAMIIAGEQLAWIYVVLMWVTIGNGLRFGKNYLNAAMGMAALGFALVLMATPYWRENLILGLGLLAGLIAIPLYLASLLRTLNRATEEARRANEAKTRFLANMSHEFRTPLNGITGMTQVLAITPLNHEQRECLTTIEASSRSLLALMEDVLDISAIEAGKFKSKPIDFELERLLEEIKNIVLPTVQDKSLGYEVLLAPEVPTYLYGDADHLRQVLLNLIGNAVKFTDKGWVSVKVNMTEPGLHEEHRLRFVISDSGIGIAQEAQEKLFDAFEQVDDGISRRHAGTGLGTTIAKGIVEALGGNMGVESTLGEGSHFWFELPFKASVDLVEQGAEILEEVADAEKQDQTNIEHPNGNVLLFNDPFLRHRARVEPKRILIADDHAANRMVLERVLIKAGHQVMSAETGEALLDLTESISHDLIITDLHMPDFSGLDLIRQLRVMEAGGFRRTPVVVFSADVTPEAINQCREAGAFAFLPKPLVVDRLLDVLASLESGREQDVGFQGNRPHASKASDAVHLNREILEEVRALGMGADFEAEFIRQCIDDAHRCIEQLLESGKQAQWSLMRDHAHALKGVASNIGFVRVANSCGIIMQKTDWQLANDWPVRINEVRELLVHAVNSLQAWRESHLDPHGKGEAST